MVVSFIKIPQALIQEEILNILRERVSACARKEGPANARAKCKDVVEAYRNAFDKSKTVSLCLYVALSHLLRTRHFLRAFLHELQTRLKSIR